MSKFTVNERGTTELIKEITKSLKLKDGDTVITQKNAQSIIIKKAGDFCFICGKNDELYMTGNENYICGDCLRAMQKAVEAEKTD